MSAIIKLKQVPNQLSRVPKPEDGMLVMQPCDQQQADQYWKLDLQGLLRPATNHKLFASVAAHTALSLDASVGLGLTLRSCRAGCRDEHLSTFEVSQGLLRSQANHKQFVLVTAGSATSSSPGDSTQDLDSPVVVRKCDSTGLADPLLCPWVFCSLPLVR